MIRVWFAAVVFYAITTGGPAQAQEKVSFASTDTDLKGGTPTNITGYLYKPDGPGPFPAVIGLHGCNGLVDQDGKVIPLYGAWGERLSKAGYLVLLPDSFGSRGHGDLCVVPTPSAPSSARSRNAARRLWCHGAPAHPSECEAKQHCHPRPIVRCLGAV